MAATVSTSTWPTQTRVGTLCQRIGTKSRPYLDCVIFMRLSAAAMPSMDLPLTDRVVTHQLAPSLAQREAGIILRK